MLRHQHIQEFHEGVRGSVSEPFADIDVGLHCFGDPLQPINAQWLSGLGAKKPRVVKKLKMQKERGFVHR